MIANYLSQKKLGGTSLRIPLGLGPGALARVHPYYSLVNAFALGRAVKQIIHMVFVSEQEMPTGSAIAIPIFNTIFNTLNTLFAIWTATSPITSTKAQVITLETLATSLLHRDNSQSSLRPSLASVKRLHRAIGTKAQGQLERPRSIDG
ncbi:hypothetical protein BDW69DRAFT_185373 [Aspergillus filifer]